MTLATEQKVVGQSHLISKLLRTLLGLALTAVSASCLLKYMWWAACYSAWTGIPKLTEQWKAAGQKASFNGSGFLILSAIAIVTLYRAIQFPRFSGFTRLASRLVVSLVITAAATTAFALILSITQIGAR